ncbi:hypothetical protein GMOD_00003967 [Pyrenophora seminiperda CCB06]|uniref:Uncharacterized protein n=1 Tax=Pyrenophora seminiperda CCB06 TaxID=1302712 RepID=A0A3M7M0D3_9PLEO|nr:hypothetical protein GMOD_00003967 [Pyrenophora seminiperda CCB06]
MHMILVEDVNTRLGCGGRGRAGSDRLLYPSNYRSVRRARSLLQLLQLLAHRETASAFLVSIGTRLGWCTFNSENGYYHATRYESAFLNLIFFLVLHGGDVHHLVMLHLGSQCLERTASIQPSESCRKKRVITDTVYDAQRLRVAFDKDLHNPDVPSVLHTLIRSVGNEYTELAASFPGKCCLTTTHHATVSNLNYTKVIKSKWQYTSAEASTLISSSSKAATNHNATFSQDHDIAQNAHVTGKISHTNPTCNIQAQPIKPPLISQRVSAKPLLRLSLGVSSYKPQTVIRFRTPVPHQPPHASPAIDQSAAYQPHN